MSTELRISDNMCIMFISYYLADFKDFTHTTFRLAKMYNTASFPIGLKIRNKNGIAI